MSWFNSWSDFTKKASEVAKSASTKAAEVAKQAADKSKVVASQVNAKVNQFVEEQKKEYNAVEQETDLTQRQKVKKQKLMESGYPPWYIDSTRPNAQIELLDELRINILKLCEDENNFLIKAPTSTSVFDFKLEFALPCAQCALAEDPVLPKIRFKIVPKKLREGQFWKNYFYRVNVIRESLGIYKLDFSKAPIPTTPRAESPSGSKSEKKAMTFPPNEDNERKEGKMEDMDKLEGGEREKSVSKSMSKKSDIIEPGKDDQTEKQPQKQQQSQPANIENKLMEDNGIKMDLSNNLNKMPSSEQITEMKSDNVNDMDLNGDDDFLADDVHIDALTDEEKAKMKKELGINGSNDVDIENVDDLLAEVNADDVDISDGELEAELANV